MSLGAARRAEAAPAGREARWVWHPGRGLSGHPDDRTWRCYRPSARKSQGHPPPCARPRRDRGRSSQRPRTGPAWDAENRQGPRLRSRSSRDAPPSAGHAVRSLRAPAPRRARAARLGITLVAFVLTQLVPGDPVAANLGEQAAADPAAVAAFHERYWGLDKPLPVQYWRLPLRTSSTATSASRSQVPPARARRPRRRVSRRRRSSRSSRSLSRCRRRPVRGDRGGPPEPRHRPRAAGRLARPASRCRRSGSRCVALYVFFFRLDWFPGGGRLDPGVLAAGHVTGHVHGRRAARRAVGARLGRAPPPGAAGARAGRLQRRPAHALHALGGARGAQQRLRPRRAREGPARADRRDPPRPPRRPAVGRHGDRPRLRERADRRGARRERSSPGRGSASTPTGRRRRSTSPRSWASASSSRSSTSRSTSSSTSSTA